MKIKNLIFDFGGVFVQLNRSRAVDAFKNLGLENAEEILDKYTQKGIFLDLEKGTITAEEYLAELSVMCGRKLCWQEVEEAWLAFTEPVSLVLLDYIASLRDKYKIYLLSNTNPFIMNWARSERFSKAGLPIDAYCDKLYMSYTMGVAKPDREIYQMLIADSGINPDETVFIDDSLANLESACEFGIRTFCPKPEEGADWIKRFSIYLDSLV